MASRMTRGQLELVRFCAVECELQDSGERSVYHMVQAWRQAQQVARSNPLPRQRDILVLGFMIEPRLNRLGYREVGAQVGDDVKPDWRLVPHQMESLVASAGRLAPDAFFKEFELIHPFRGGNGRVGQILYNWLNKSLLDPQWAPNFFDDPRRLPDWGGARQVLVDEKMATNDRPKPGSEQARAEGCKCPVYDNNHGRFAPHPPDGWWVHRSCPLHQSLNDGDYEAGSG